MRGRVSRRGLLAGGAGLSCAALLPSVAAAPAAAADGAAGKEQPGGLFPPDRIGIQLYSVADQIEARGFARVLEDVARIGYRQVEFAGYTQGTTPEITPAQLRALLDANGLRAIGSHVSPAGDESMKRILEEAAALGVPNVGISLPLPSAGPTAAGWKQLSAEYNRFGEMAAKEGIGFYLHNHFHEWFQCPDDLSLRGEDILLAETDPRYVFFEMDVYWAYVGQWQQGNRFDPLQDYAIPHRDRYKLFHVKDGRKDLLGGYTDALVNIVDAGQGSIDFQGFFDAVFAQSVGEVDKHFYIWERDNASDHPRGSMAAARASFTYIRYGLTGPNLPAPEPTGITAAVSDVGVRRSRSGARTVRAVLETEEPLTVTLRAHRKGRTLARKKRGTLPAGRHVVSLRLPRTVAAGSARLELTLRPAGGRAARKVRVPIAVPARG